VQVVSQIECIAIRDSHSCRTHERNDSSHISEWRYAKHLLRTLQWGFRLMDTYLDRMYYDMEFDLRLFTEADEAIKRLNEIETVLTNY
jgi:hypothetical protein